MMVERGISVDHATIHRWVVRYSSESLERFNLRKRTVSRKWHVDETYTKVRGRWMYLYPAIDNVGDTVEFWFSERRDLAAASSREHSSGTAVPRRSSSTEARPTGKRSCPVIR
jgi:putative transposase